MMAIDFGRLRLGFLHTSHALAIAALATALSCGITAAAVVDATWQLNGDGNWNTGSNWSPSGVPDNTILNQYNVRIDNDANFNVIVSLNASLDINNLTVDAGDSLSFVNGMDLQIYGTSVINNGTIALNGILSATNLTFAAASTTLSGSGALTLSGASVNHINGSSGSEQLINGSTHTIAGGGLLGQNQLVLTNQGTVDANVAGQELTVDSNLTAVNTGTMRASNGGILRLQRATLTNTSGFIRALTGSTVELGPGLVIDGGTLDSEGTGALHFDANNLTLRDVTLDAGGLLRIFNNRDPILEGTITNNGTVEQNSTGGATDTLISGAVTLAGTGEWKMSNSAFNTFGVSGIGSVFTNGPSHTIRGAGNIGAIGMDFENQGTILADQATPLMLQLFSSAAVTNSGTLRADSGGRLEVRSPLNSTAGLIDAKDMSTVVIASGAATLNGDMLSTSGSGVIQFDAVDSHVLNGVTIDGLVRFSNDVDPTLTGTISNNGIVEQNSTGAATNVQILGGATLTGTGVWKMSNNAANSFNSPFAAIPTLTNDTNHTIEGAGSMGANMFNFDNKGLLDANQSTPLIVAPNATATNTGTMQASAGGTLRLNAGTYTNTGGTIRALDASTVELISGGTFVGGAYATTGSGVIKVNTVTLQDPTVQSGSKVQILDNADPILQGTVTNHGTVEQNSAGALTQAKINGNVLLTGSGVWKMTNNANNQILGTASGNILTNDASHTIQGSGNLGANMMGVVNKGLILADQTVPITIDPSTAGFVNQSTGTLRASLGGDFNMTGGSFNNQGTFEALNGGSIIFLATSGTANILSGGVLTGGTWRSYSPGGGSGSDIALRGPAITRIAAGTEIEITGSTAQFRVIVGAVSTPLESTLTENDGTLRILVNRNYTAASINFLNDGELELGGGTFNTNSLSNSPNGEIFGYGTITPRPSSFGTIRAAFGGTLSFGSGIGGSGTVQIDSLATINISGGAMDSTTNNLIHNGAAMALGNNDIQVQLDYQNGSFGAGNSFNPRANVTGAGQLNATPGTNQVLLGNVTGGTTPTVTMNLGNLHVGDFATRNYQIGVTGTPVKLRGAIQTNVGGANITDSRLSGAGVTAGNFGPIDFSSMSGNFAVTFNGTTAGPLSGQQVRVVNNFDNVTDQILQFTGAVYRLAEASAHTPEPVDFGIVHVGDVLQQALTISNTAINDGYSERLDATFGAPTGDATSSGFRLGLPPGDTDSTNLIVGIDTSTAGAKSGTAQLQLQSTGMGTSGLGNTQLTWQTVNVQAQVNNFAVADVVKITGSGSFTMTGANDFTLDLGSVDVGQASLSAELGVQNVASAPADDLAGSFSLAAPDFSLMGFSPFAGLPAGGTQSSLIVQLSSSSAGTFTGQITLQPQSTNARPFSMNLAPITIHLVGEVVLPGDFNFDGNVDAADYVVWRKGLGTTHTTGDFDVWRANFGRSAPGAGSGSAHGTTAETVPEPGSALAVVIGIGAFALIRLPNSRFVRG
jgi:hypothetical protein